MSLLEAIKKKNSIKITIDESVDLDSQIENISVILQELTAYKQMVNARNRYVGQIINNTKAQRYKERLVTRDVVNA
uniref:Uncharacterized protein n=1 Tax=Borrelia miyamotoi TaxID=47466 RepID=A0A482CY27_9SPIR|nr:hypothetical protein EZU71_07200 [Borrelia miyamotoi]